MGKAALVILVSLAVSVAVLFSQGVAFSFLWEWFVAQPFGLPLISTPIWMGLLMMLSYVRAGGDISKVSRSFVKGGSLEENVQHAVTNFAGPWSLLLFGYVIHLFV